VSFLFEAGPDGRMTVREEPAPIAPVWGRTVDEVTLLAGEDGAATITIRRGDRIAWECPGGLGGCTMYGTVAGLQVDDGNLSVIGIDAEPSDALRAVAAEIRASFGKHGWERSGFFPALAGEGGLAIFTGDVAIYAARDGKLRLAPLEAKP